MSEIGISFVFSFWRFQSYYLYYVRFACSGRVRYPLPASDLFETIAKKFLKSTKNPFSVKKKFENGKKTPKTSKTSDTRR